jgi:hypothetical protein
MITDQVLNENLLALPTKARIYVFIFIIEYNSFKDFGP